MSNFSTNITPPNLTSTPFCDNWSELYHFSASRTCQAHGMFLPQDDAQLAAFLTDLVGSSARHAYRRLRWEMNQYRSETPGHHLHLPERRLVLLGMQRMVEVADVLSRSPHLKDDESTRP